MDARLDGIKLALLAEQRKREALEAWQRNAIKVHLSLLDTRDSLWEDA